MHKCKSMDSFEKSIGMRTKKKRERKRGRDRKKRIKGRDASSHAYSRVWTDDAKVPPLSEKFKGPCGELSLNRP